MLRTLIQTGLLGRCPGCAQRSMFEGFYDIPITCTNCELQYQVGDGAWLGAVAIGYGFGAIFAILAAVVEMTWSPIRNAGLDPLWTIAVASLVVTAVGYRLAKSLWFSLLYTFGLMRWPDGTASSPAERATTL
ncbi:MAG: DUF983 domain-containing protein [Dehalococcoidia bacterium]|jgi:uncharacterized protein (DUF983 family)|nr:DUF983 domain-containing protein [Dehalococcoidia bacterium]